MEDRDRDKITRKDSSTPSHSEKDDKEVDFGKNIGRPEELEQPSRGSGGDRGESERSSSGGGRGQGGSMGRSRDH